MYTETGSRLLQTWVQEMMEKRRMGARAGAGGDRDGKFLWLFYSMGDALESRIVLRPVVVDGEPRIEVHRMEGEATQLVSQISRLMAGL